MTTNELSSIVLAGSIVASLGLGCAAHPACRKGPADDVAMGARTAGEAVETGVETGVEGVKTGGKAVGGWVEGGSAGAKKNWNEGKRETKAEAREGAAQTKGEANVPPCD